MPNPPELRTMETRLLNFSRRLESLILSDPNLKVFLRSTELDHFLLL
jgi:hypothetical protein